MAALSQQVQSELRDIEQDAVNGLVAMNADDRQQVRIYYTALWLWNRLEKQRWKMAKLALRQESRRQISLEVDHVVAWDLWKSKVNALQAQPPKDGETLQQLHAEELGARVNELGNCMLLEKNFNIVKSNKPLKEFLEGVHEFRDGTLTIDQWASGLNLEGPQIDSAHSTVEVLRQLFVERTQRIRGDLEQFVRGTKARIDLHLD
jgi:hypothetical protein